MKVSKTILAITVAGLAVSATQAGAARAPTEWRPNTPLSAEERDRIAGGTFGNKENSVVEIKCSDCTGFFGSPTERSWNLGEYSAPDDAERIVIYIKGGDGDSFKFEPGGTIPNWTHRRGTSKASADLRYKNAVFFVDFDRPMSRLGKGGYSAKERDSKNHHRLLDDVVDYAINKYPNLPVVLLGHSNGTVSVNRYIKWLDKQDRLDKIAGIVLSASHDGERFNARKLPALAIGHEADPCRFDKGFKPGYTTQSVYKMISKSSEVAEIAWTSGGIKDMDFNGCRMGYHSYEGSEAQFTEAVQSFMDRNIKQ